MLYWKFKDVICYKDEYITQDSRKFEILVENYLQKCYPMENWQLTKATRDGNKDIENICEFSGTSMWAEVKYTTHTNTNVASRKYDSTLVSSIFEKDLIKIFFITNTSIGSNLIGRIKKFYYLSSVKKVSFVDGYSLAYWIKQNPDIEKRFFQEPIAFTLPTTPSVKLLCVRVLCKNDSYTIDSLLEDQNMYPLYLSRNYILEGEFTAIGFDDKPVTLYCNEKLLYTGHVLPEIMSFSIDVNEMSEPFDIQKEYPLRLYYFVDDERHICGEYNLRFASIGRLFENQVQCYNTVYSGIKAYYKKIYNIYGPQCSGKSWILNNLKNDLLRNEKEDTRIIYVNFSGRDSDVADICRILFTLCFNYYNLSISARALSLYCEEHSVKNSFFNPHNIDILIRALRDNDYPMVQSILKGSVSSKTEMIFEMKQDFNYERIYFIDNVHLLSSDNYSVLYTILNAFNPLRQVSIIMTNQTSILNSNIENIELKYIEEHEILDSINEKCACKIENINEFLPSKHYLMYPGLLHAFLQEVDKHKDISTIKNYYIDTFQLNASNYVKGSFNFEDNLLLFLICFVKNGIPSELLQNIVSTDLYKLIESQQVVHRYGYVYPNYERWDRIIPQELVREKKVELTTCILKFFEKDSSRIEIYQCCLMEYYPEYYNQYFESMYEKIEEAFKKNKYQQVISLCEVIINQQSFYAGDYEKLNTIKYNLAFSYMHCNTSKDYKGLFGEIVSYYEQKPKNDLYFKALSQIIDAKYWGFQEFKKLPDQINEFRKNWKLYSCDGIDINARAYLTATNRMMVTYLALDDMDMAEKWFRKNIKLASIFNAAEHIGYTYMDYAKGIYHKDMPLALHYLEVADRYFKPASELRRHFDCQCEIQYVKCALGEGSIQQLLLAQETLFENQYWIQYYKCFLKLAVCYILKGNKPAAYKCLIEAEAPDIIRKDERTKYFFDIIGSYLYNKPVAYENIALAGTTYQNILEHARCSLGQEKVKLYTSGDNGNEFYLDPRVW